MKLIHVMEIGEGIVQSINTFPQKLTEDAHDLFKEFARENILLEFTDDQLNKSIEEGHVEASSHDYIVQIFRSEVK